jgi:cardiolipin synthase
LTLFVTLLIAGNLLLGYVLWGRTRRNAIDVRIADGDLPSLVRSMAGLTWGHLTEGNLVRIVQNSGFFDALLDDVARASHHIHLETFLWRDSRISERVTEALSAKARAGVEVRVLVDQRGAKRTSPRIWQRLREAGVDFRVYRRARFREFALYNHRDHRKIAVIDGRAGYTFGHGIDDMWGGTPDRPTGWRDTAARFEGPVVNDLQSAFFDNWSLAAGTAMLGESYFPVQPAPGSTPLHVAFVRQPGTMSAVHRLYALAIAAARREIILQNPYFLPDGQALSLFAGAVKRGVSITIMLPTSATSDFAIVQHASHHFYGPLLRLGVRMYEYTRSGLHQKVTIVDREWCSIGSTNFDPRSFRINEEITVAALDRGLAQQLYEAFQEDLADADLWTYERWMKRSVGHKVKDLASAFCKRQL